MLPLMNCMKLFEPSLGKMVFFLIVFIIGLGIFSGPYYIIAPGGPGHEITWGMYGITFGDTSNFMASLLGYGSIFVIIISLFFIIVYFIKEFKKKK
jgi:hypothetical protein